MIDAIRRGLTRLGVLAGHPIAFLLVALYAVLWYALEPQSLDMHGVATLVTLLIALLIQRSEHRDTQAIHAKLDELVRTQTNARNSIAQIDKKEPEDIERQREGGQAPG